jgi:hypothetical protein
VIVKGTPATRPQRCRMYSDADRLPGGGHVRLGDVAEVRIVQTPPVFVAMLSRGGWTSLPILVAEAAAIVVAELEKQLATHELPDRIPR